MTWAQRLKRVFNIDIEVCSHGVFARASIGYACCKSTIEFFVNAPSAATVDADNFANR
tara:strand:- start:126 stop:299 length:174 start_codon:yes stop_codon:yes gene_type:complete